MTETGVAKRPSIAGRLREPENSSKSSLSRSAIEGLLWSTSARDRLRLARPGRLPLKQRLQVLPGVRLRVARKLSRCPGPNEGAAAFPTFRPEDDQPVRRLDDVKVVL